MRALPLPYEEPPARCRCCAPRCARAALAAAGGVLAGAATVAAVRAVSAVGSQGALAAPPRPPPRAASNVVASRSFLVDVHLLGR